MNIQFLRDKARWVLLVYLLKGDARERFLVGSCGSRNGKKFDQTFYVYSLSGESMRGITEKIATKVFNKAEKEGIPYFFCDYVMNNGDVLEFRSVRVG